jgi:hypothetical protein
VLSLRAQLQAAAAAREDAEAAAHEARTAYIAAECTSRDVAERVGAEKSEAHARLQLEQRHESTSLLAQVRALQRSLADAEAYSAAQEVEVRHAQNATLQAEAAAAAAADAAEAAAAAVAAERRRSADAVGAAVAAATAASTAEAATARAEAAEAREKHAALSSSHERLGNKVRDLMELESDFGSSGREAAYRETVQRLQLELSAALESLRFVESSRQLETSQALQAIAHAEREAAIAAREAYVPQIASAREEAQAQAQAQASMAIEVAREALAEAVGAAQAEAKARQAEAAAAAEQFKELTNELLRWRGPAEALEAALAEQRALNAELAASSDERVGRVQRAVEQQASLIGSLRAAFAKQLEEAVGAERQQATAQAEQALRNALTTVAAERAQDQAQLASALQHSQTLQHAIGDAEDELTRAREMLDETGAQLAAAQAALDEERDRAAEREQWQHEQHQQWQHEQLGRLEQQQQALEAQAAAAHRAQAEAAAQAAAEAARVAEATQAAAVEAKREAIWKEVEERWVRRDVHKLEMEAEAARQVGAAVEHVAEQWKARLHEVRLSCAAAMERAVQDAVAEAVNEAVTEAGRTEWQLRAQLQHLTRQAEEVTAARAKAEAACAEATALAAKAAEEATSSKHTAAMVAADKQRAEADKQRASRPNAQCSGTRRRRPRRRPSSRESAS